MADRKLSFIVVGVQKGGTTTLDDILRRHGQIGMAQKRKEVHFFDDERRQWDVIDQDAYHEFFDFSSSNSIYGETTPLYIYWPNSLERIAKYNPRIKIIALFRDR